MRYLIAFCLIFPTVLLPSSIVYAEIKLNWDRCLQQFNKNNPNVLAADLNLKGSTLQKKSAASGYWPTLTLNANSILGAASQSASKAKDTSASLTLTQNLYAGFATEANLTQAEANVLNSKAASTQIYTNYLYELKLAYADLILTQKNKKLLSDIIQRRQENYDMVKLRFKNGNENKGSLLQAEANLKLAQYEKLVNQNAIKTAQQKIKNLLNLDDDNIELTSDIESTVLTKNLSSPESFQSLIETHPEHEQALAQKQLADASLATEKSSLYPTINWQYTYSNSGEDYKLDKNSWYTGVNLSWSLFNGGKNYYAIQSQINIKQGRELQLIAIDRTIFENLISAKNQFIEASEKWEVDSAFLKASQVREQILRAKYNNGLSNFDEWDLIETELINREKNLLRSEHEKTVSEANWIKAQGSGSLKGTIE